MSKIAEKRTDEIVGEFHNGDYTDHSRHNTQWIAFKQGYDQAVQDLLKDANQYMFLSDEIGYAYASGCRKTMQDFLEKAEKFFNSELYVSVSNQICSQSDFTSMTKFIEQFKNHMQDEM